MPPPLLLALQTLEGSVACFVAGALGTAAYLAYFSHAGMFAQPLAARDIAWGSAAAALAGALIESLPLLEVDNLTVPLAAGLTAAACLGGRST